MSAGGQAELSPYARALGMTLLETVQDSDGYDGPQLMLGFGDAVLGWPGRYHGGAVAGLLDAALTIALAQAMNAAGAQDKRSARQITITVDYMRGAGAAPTYAAGRVLRLGRSLAHVSAAAWQTGVDRPVALAQAHFLLRDARVSPSI